MHTEIVVFLMTVFAGGLGGIMALAARRRARQEILGRTQGRILQELAELPDPIIQLDPYIITALSNSFSRVGGLEFRNLCLSDRLSLILSNSQMIGVAASFFCEVGMPEKTANDLDFWDGTTGDFLNVVFEKYRNFIQQKNH